MITTLTPQAACERLRASGMKIGMETLYAGIEQGVYPWGIYIQTPKGNPVYQIFGKLLDAWIAERAETP